MIFLNLYNEPNSKQSSRHEYVWHEKEETKSNCVWVPQEKPSTVVLCWVSPLGNIKLFPPRGLRWWRLQAAFGTSKNFGPLYPLSFWPHHSQTVRQDPAIRTKDEMSSGWKRNPFPVVWQMHMDKVKPRSSYGESCFSRKLFSLKAAARGTGSDKKPWDWRYN